MTKLGTSASALHSIAGPVLMLLYPLYASVIAIESPSKVDDEQWLFYWIIYSFLTLAELIFQSLIERIPIWYTVKLVFVAWLVLPQFRGAAFIYNKFVREQIGKYGIVKLRDNTNLSNSKKETQTASMVVGVDKNTVTQIILPNGVVTRHSPWVSQRRTQEASMVGVSKNPTTEKTEPTRIVIK